MGNPSKKNVRSLFSIGKWSGNQSKNKVRINSFLFFDMVNGRGFDHGH